MNKNMFIFSLDLDHVHKQRFALNHDFSQHGNTRAISQDTRNKVSGITYLKQLLRYFLLNEKVIHYFTSYL